MHSNLLNHFQSRPRTYLFITPNTMSSPGLRHPSAVYDEPCQIKVESVVGDDVSTAGMMTPRTVDTAGSCTPTENLEHLDIRHMSTLQIANEIISLQQRMSKAATRTEAVDQEITAITSQVAAMTFRLTELASLASKSHQMLDADATRSQALTQELLERTVQSRFTHESSRIQPDRTEIARQPTLHWYLNKVPLGRRWKDDALKLEAKFCSTLDTHYKVSYNSNWDYRDFRSRLEPAFKELHKHWSSYADMAPETELTEWVDLAGPAYWNSIPSEPLVDGRREPNSRSNWQAVVVEFISDRLPRGPGTEPLRYVRVEKIVWAFVFDHCRRKGYFESLDSRQVVISQDWIEFWTDVCSQVSQSFKAAGVTRVGNSSYAE